jgi:RNA polymerase sigma-32 factor
VEAQVTEQLDARQQALVVQYMGLAGSITGRRTYRNLRCDKDDALAEAYLGLVEAARRFDETRGVSFATYASYWIEAKLLLYIVRVSQGQVRHITTAGGRKVYFQLGRACRALGEHASDEAVAKHLGVDEEVVATARERREAPDVSINAFAWGQDVKCESLLTDEQVILAEEHGELLNLVWRTQLNDRERQIVRERLLAEEPRKLESFGIDWGVTRQRVQQIEKQVLSKLRLAAGAREQRVQRKARARRRAFSKSRLAQSLP